MDFQIAWNVYQQKYRFKYLALYHALRDAIVNGTLPFGTKLPSNRELAALYQLSRGIVTQVYEMLASEGYVSSEVGSGTYVSFNHQENPATREETEPIQLSDWGLRLERLKIRQTDETAELPVRYDFTTRHTEEKEFPHAEWKRTLYQSVRELSEPKRGEAFASQGHLPLREAIARNLRRSRGIDTEADDIVIVNGSMQAIALLAQLLVNPGDAIVLEDPGYRGIWQAVDAVAGQVIPGAVDEQGIVVEDWAARLLFVTPSRQFPTGAVLSLERRQEILRWAQRKHAVIVEDDYDSEFRYRGRPIEPLKVLDSGDRVVYIGTFSKTLFSDIRIGYVVLPTWLRLPFVKARALYEPHPTSLIQQHALAHFMNSGQYERHLRRMKRTYSKRYKVCFQELQARLSRWFDFVETDAGLHIFGIWKGSAMAYAAMRETCRQQGIVWSESGVTQRQPDTVSICFGFAAVSEEEIREGIRAMQDILLTTE